MDFGVGNRFKRAEMCFERKAFLEVRLVHHQLLGLFHRPLNSSINVWSRLRRDCAFLVLEGLLTNARRFQGGCS